MTAILQTMRDGGEEHPQEIMNFLASRIIDRSGVTTLDNSNLLVEEADTPALSVQINEGYAYIKTSDSSMSYPVRLISEPAIVAVDAEASGNNRIDAVVLYIDTGADPNEEITNVAKLAVVKGTPAGSPSAPDNTAITSSIGASNPYILLAEILVGSGETEIYDADITDRREVILIKNTAKKAVTIQLTGKEDDIEVMDGIAFFPIPSFLDGYYLINVFAEVQTAGTTGTTDIQVHNDTANVDMLSTKLTIDSGETTSDTASTPAVINTDNNQVSSHDRIRIDIDAVSSTAPQGGSLLLEFSPVNS